MVFIDCIRNHSFFNILPGKSYLYENAAKISVMTGVALACLAATVWSTLRQKPGAALVMAATGVCLEIVLSILWPNRRRIQVEAPKVKFDSMPPLEKVPLEEQIEEQNQIEKALAHLEQTYPVKPIDPVVIRDRQIGGMQGQAFGDAIGLWTEFTTRAEAQEMIGGRPMQLGPHYPPRFKNGYNWNHIKRFTKNGWTDDTDQALSLVRALYRYFKGDQKEQMTSLFADELMKWRKGGLKTDDLFLGRQNPYCMGLGALVSSVLKEENFLKEPLQAAEKVWAQDPQKPLRDRPAANGAVMRTAPIGLIFYHSLEDVVTYTVDACKVTHADPRCTASCVAVTVALALIMRGYQDCQTLFDAAETIGLAVLREELTLAAQKKLLSNEESQDLEALYAACAEDFKQHLHGDWTFLDLDEGFKEAGKINKIGYTFKCMGAAFYALKQADQQQKQGKTDIFRRLIEEIAGEGGDADTNGAVAGALIGAFLGYQGQFPKNWTDNLADKPAIEQAAQHIEELKNLHFLNKNN